MFKLLSKHVLRVQKRLNSSLKSARLEYCRELTQMDSHLEEYFCERLQQRFGFDTKHAKQTSIYCRFASHLKSRESIDKSIELIERHFTANDISFNPQIFVLHFKTISKRLMILKELGFSDFKIADTESSYLTVLKESPQRLKEINAFNGDCVQSLLTCVHCERRRQSIEEELRSENPNVESMSFETIRRIAVTKYVSEELDISLDKALKIWDQKWLHLRKTPLRTVVTNCDLLVKDLEIPKKRMVGSSFLLCVDPHNVRDICDNVKSIGGQRLKDICSKYPKLLATNCETIVNNLKEVKDNGFSDEQLRACVPVLLLNTGGLKKRIRTVRTHPELSPLCESKLSLYLIYYLNTALNRLEYMRAKGVENITLIRLISRKCFESACGEYYGKSKRGFSKFVSKQFNMDFESVRVRSGSHPFERRFDVRNADRVLQWLRAQDVTDEQFFNGIYVLLYDLELVRNQFQMLSPQHRDEPYLLQHVLYHIEKHYGFSGSGVYVKH